MIQRFWLWLYRLSREHIPQSYVDEAWLLYVQDRLSELGEQYGEEFVLWLVSDLEGEPFATATREIREEVRESRDIQR